MKKAIELVAVCIFLSSCEKAINLNLEDKSGQLVIEGNITDQTGPYFVRISRSVAFTSPNEYPDVTDAHVFVRDQTGMTDTLQYTGNGLYKTTRLTGTPGFTYQLTVQADGQTYNASCRMPERISLEGVEQDSISFGGTVSYTALPLFTDPSAQGNRYLFIATTSRLRDKILEVFSDNINNGVPNQRSLMLVFNNADEDLKSGDSVKLEMQCISENIYTYYSSLIQLSGDGPGGGITPSNPVSNLSNGALGYFSAHTQAIHRFVIQ